jgi:hypothetical protein
VTQAQSARRFEELVKGLANAGVDGGAVSEPIEDTVQAPVRRADERRRRLGRLARVALPRLAFEAEVKPGA